MLRAETTKELAMRWGVTPTRVAQIIREGKLPSAMKIGRDWLIAGYPAFHDVQQARGKNHVQSTSQQADTRVA